MNKWQHRDNVAQHYQQLWWTDSHYLHSILSSAVLDEWLTNIRPFKTSSILKFTRWQDSHNSSGRQHIFVAALEGSVEIRNVGQNSSHLQMQGVSLQQPLGTVRMRNISFWNVHANENGTVQLCYLNTLSPFSWDLIFKSRFFSVFLEMIKHTEPFSEVIRELLQSNPLKADFNT